MNYTEFLYNTAKKNNSIICFGMDPVLEKIPLKGSIYKRIYSFYETILTRMIQKNVLPGAVKPNYAFYAQYGFQGIKALEKIITLFQSEFLPVILDAKRGDIGSTAEAYAIEAFSFFHADAVTLAPYMGYDSIKPFVSKYPGKGYYILTKTSNKSSCEIQDLISGGITIHEHVAKKIIEWYHPGIGSVVGATFPEQLAKINSIFGSSGKKIPLLIPGIGSQGGSIIEILRTISHNEDTYIHRINSSSALNFAYQDKPGAHYADASVNALSELNNEIEVILNGNK